MELALASLPGELLSHHFDLGPPGQSEVTEPPALGPPTGWK